MSHNRPTTRNEISFCEVCGATLNRSEKVIRYDLHSGKPITTVEFDCSKDKSHGTIKLEATVIPPPPPPDRWWKR